MDNSLSNEEQGQGLHYVEVMELCLKYILFPLFTKFVHK